MEIKDFLTLGLACAVAIIAYAQWRTANQRVVIDLFERRLRVYEAFRDVVVEIAKHGEASPTSGNRFWSVQADAEFLFGADVHAFLTRVGKYIIALHTLREIDDLHPRRDQLIEYKSEIFMRLSNSLQEATTVFKPYIGLSQKNTPFWRPW
jgi:hypothetical protein